MAGRNWNWWANRRGGVAVLTTAWILAVLLRLAAQEPIPEARMAISTAKALTLAGRVLDANGTPLKGVKIAVATPTGVATQIESDADGQFRTGKLTPGMYRVTATFASARSVATVELRVGESTVLNIALPFALPLSPEMSGPVSGPGGATGQGAPIPIGDRVALATPLVPRPVAPPTAGSVGTGGRGIAGGVEVAERSFSDDLDAQQWLNEEAQKGKTISSVVTVKPGTSLFVLVSTGRKFMPSVLRVQKALNAKDLQARIALHPDDVFTGVHVIDDNSYLMVFRHD